MITVLIAYGPNSVTVPCRLFENMEDGRAYCDPLFAKINIRPETDSSGGVRYSANLEGIEDEEVSEALFTSFYYGCGGPYPFVLKEIPFNEKFVPFDLD